MDNPPNDIIVETSQAAIRNLQVVQIRVKNTWRTVEPYLVGLHGVTQRPVLYGYCRDVVPDYRTPSRWEVFYLDEIDSIDLTSYSFQPHSDYKGQIDSVDSVWCRVKPPLDDVTPAHWPVRLPPYLIRKIRLSR